MKRAERKAQKRAEVDRLAELRLQKELAVFGTTERLSPDKLDQRELWWRDHFEWLKARGYLLRPRYSPDWVPSWRNSMEWYEHEDASTLQFGTIIDCTRISDGLYLSLKRIEKSVHPYEVDIGLYFMSESLVSDPANHCIPIYEAFDVDDDENFAIIVMPLLRYYQDPHFDTFGEAVECFRQLFEGLKFMHDHHVAHRDCMGENIMLDPSELYPDSFHPMNPRLKRDYRGDAKHFTRTQRPPKYYFIDFGLSRRYDPSDTDPREVPIWGGDKEVPEFQNSNEPCNPFPTDVFYIGNVIKKDFIQTKRGFQFMEPLVADMTQADPSKRPRMDEVVSRFDKIRSSLRAWKLRSRIVDEDEDAFERVVRTASHWTRRIGFVTRRVPAIPAPS